MQSKLITLELKLSSIWLIITILIAAFVACDLVAFAYLGTWFLWVNLVLISIICSYSLMLAWHYSTCQLSIASHGQDTHITLYINTTSTPMYLVSCRQYSFLLTVVKLRNENNKITTIPIFIDSLTLEHYKKLRALLQWN